MQKALLIEGWLQVSVSWLFMMPDCLSMNLGCWSVKCSCKTINSKPAHPDCHSAYDRASPYTLFELMGSFKIVPKPSHVTDLGRHARAQHHGSEVGCFVIELRAFCMKNPRHSGTRDARAP